jgi:hypothetical protein
VNFFPPTRVRSHTQRGDYPPRVVGSKHKTLAYLTAPRWWKKCHPTSHKPQRYVRRTTKTTGSKLIRMQQHG